ncbi:MAG: preprotein translocase subunit SecG [Christensenellales bacterium]
MFNFDSTLMAIKNVTNMTYEVRQGTLIALMVLMVLMAIAMVVVVLMQQGTDENVQAITGSSDSYYGKNKARSKEGILKKITLVLFCLIMVTSIIFFIISMVDVGTGATV